MNKIINSNRMLIKLVNNNKISNNNNKYMNREILSIGKHSTLKHFSIITTIIKYKLLIITYNYLSKIKRNNKLL